MNNKIVTVKDQRVQINNDTTHIPDEIIPRYLATLNLNVETEMKKRVDRGIPISFAAQELFIRAVLHEEKINLWDDDEEKIESRDDDL